MVEYWHEKRLLQQKGESSRMQTHNGKLARASSRRAARPAGTPPAEEGIVSSGIAFQLWRLYQPAWLVSLIFPLASLVRNPLPVWHLALGGVALVGFAASYTWLMWPHPASQGARLRVRSPISYLLFVALSVLVLVFSLMDGPAWLWLFIGVSAIAGVLLPMRSAFAAVGGFSPLPPFLLLDVNRGLPAGGPWGLLPAAVLGR